MLRHKVGPIGRKSNYKINDEKKIFSFLELLELQKNPFNLWMAENSTSKVPSSSNNWIKQIESTNDEIEKTEISNR